MQTRAKTTQATRDRIVGAMLELCLDRWYDEITLRDVAEGAGVSLQTVLNHFSSKEGVIAAIVDDPRTEQRFGARRLTKDPADAAGAVALLLADYERGGDAAMRFLALETRVPALAPLLAFGRTGHREWVERVFASTLAGLDSATRERRTLELVCATDLYVWQILRRDQGLSRRRVHEVMTEMVEAICLSEPRRRGGR